MDGNPERKPKLIGALAGYHHSRQLLAGVVLSEDGDILAGAVVPADSRLDLPSLLGVGSTNHHADYLQRYPQGFEIEWTWEPDRHAGFQSAQQRLLAACPDYKYDPWNPRPFWASRAYVAIAETTTLEGDV